MSSFFPDVINDHVGSCFARPDWRLSIGGRIRGNQTGAASRLIYVSPNIGPSPNSHGGGPSGIQSVSSPRQVRVGDGDSAGEDQQLSVQGGPP
jgi:hypothetical protein